MKEKRKDGGNMIEEAKSFKNLLGNRSIWVEDLMERMANRSI